MVSENGTGVPAIIGDAIGGRVRRRWRVPIRIDSDLVLLRARPLWHCVWRGPSFPHEPRKGHSSAPLFGPCLLWPRSLISATAELLISLCLKYLGNCWTDLRQIYREDVFGRSLERLWRSRSKVKGQGHQIQKPAFVGPFAACVRLMFGKTSLASSILLFYYRTQWNAEVSVFGAVSTPLGSCTKCNKDNVPTLYDVIV